MDTVQAGDTQVPPTMHVGTEQVQSVPPVGTEHVPSGPPAVDKPVTPVGRPLRQRRPPKRLIEQC